MGANRWGPESLRYADFAPGLPFHAALVGASGLSHPSHDHDFYELMAVVNGAATHVLESATHPLRAGSIVLVRPADRHRIQRAEGSLRLINVAFPNAPWRDFLALCEAERLGARFDAADRPPTVTTTVADRERCMTAFEDVLVEFQHGPTRVGLCRFWAAILPALESAADVATSPGAVGPPEWLSSALAAMSTDEDLRAGLPRLIELTAVSHGHLARSTKAFYGAPPTAVVNELRLRRAAVLLATTSESIPAIAGRCGFSSLSYFYRLFSTRFGRTPLVQRRAAARSVLPAPRPSEEHAPSDAT